MVQALELHVEELDAAQLGIDAGTERVELQRSVHPPGLEALGEPQVVRDAPAVGGDQESLDLAGMGPFLHVITEVEELGMERGLTPGQQENGELTFRRDKIVDRPLEVFKRHGVPVLVADNAHGTLQVADVVDLEDRGAGMLQMVFTQAAVGGAPVLHLGGEAQRHRARFRVGE